MMRQYLAKIQFHNYQQRNLCVTILILSTFYICVLCSNFSVKQTICRTKEEWRELEPNMNTLKRGHMKYSFQYPMVIVSFKYHLAGKKAWSILNSKESNALEAVKAAISWCEMEAVNCSSVGYGKHPDESGEPTIDATLFDGDCVCAGAVGSLQRVKHGIRAAEIVMTQSPNKVLLRDHATRFVAQYGMEEQCLVTQRSECELKEWKEKKCQPNFWMNTKPDSMTSCGPYKALPRDEVTLPLHHFKPSEFVSHDSMGVIAIDKSGSIAAGTSSSGMAHKIPGRIGIAAIPGSGTFADSNCCGCVAIGWGDHMMKFAPAALTCDLIRQGLTPAKAAKRVVARIWTADTRAQVAILAVNKKGVFGVGCIGITRPPKYIHSVWRIRLGTFPYFVHSGFGARRYWSSCNGELDALDIKIKYKKKKAQPARKLSLKNESNKNYNG